MQIPIYGKVEVFYEGVIPSSEMSDDALKLADQRQHSGGASVVGGRGRVSRKMEVALLCDLDLKSTLLTSFISFELNDLKHISASKRSISFQMDAKEKPQH